MRGTRPPGARTTLFNRGQRYEKPGAEAAVRDYVELAREYGLDPALMANEDKGSAGARRVVRMALADPVGFAVYGAVSAIVALFPARDAAWSRGR